MKRRWFLAIFSPIVVCGLGCAALSGLSDFDEVATTKGGDAGSDSGGSCAPSVAGASVWNPTILPNNDREYETLGNAIADLDSDGNQDIVFASQLTRNLNVFYGYGDGTFAPLVDYAGARFGGRAPAVGDLDGDGRLDVLLSSKGDLVNSGGPPSALLVLAGLNKRGFSSPKTIAEGAGPGEVELVDADKDGRLDILVALSASPEHGACTALRLNTGQGKPGVFTFAPAKCVATPGLRWANRFDVEGKGFPELLVMQGDALAIGRFDINLELQIKPIPMTPLVAIGYIQPLNLNDDAFGDFIVAGARDAASQLIGFYGRGDGTFDECQIASGVPPFGAAGFLNDDKLIDLSYSEVITLKQSIFSVMIQTP